MKKCILILLFWVLIITILLVMGCAGNKRKPVEYKPKTVTEYIEVVKEVTKLETTIKNLSWVQGVLVIGAVGSVFACFMGAAKFGAPALAACIAGYGLLSAGVYYPKWIALFGLVGGVGVCCWAIWINRRAFREVVAGGELFKERYIEASKPDEITYTTDMFRTAQSSKENGGTQSKSTQKLVDKVKEKL